MAHREMRRKLDEPRGDVHGPRGRPVATSVETNVAVEQASRLLSQVRHKRDACATRNREEKTFMLPFLTPDHADLFYQTVVGLTAMITVVFTSLAAWLRC